MDGAQYDRSRWKALAAAALIAGALAGQACGVHVAQDCAAEAACGEGESRAALTALARDYLYKEVDGAESEAISDRIRNLAPADARTFHALLIEQNGYTGVERMLSDAAFEYAAERGISFLDLTSEDGDAVMQSVIRELSTQPR